MMELQTREGQAAHYAAVRMRLGGGSPVSTLVDRMLISPPAPCAAEVTTPASRAAPALIDHIRKRPALSVPDIINLISFCRDVPVVDIMGPDRFSHIMDARREAIFVVWTVKIDMTLHRIGKAFGRDHSSIFNCVNTQCKILGVTYSPDRSDCIEAGLRILRDAGWKPVHDEDQPALQRLVDGAR